MKANIISTLGNLSRTELGSIATKGNLPKGKSREDTQKSIAKAIEAGKLRFSVTVTVRDNSDPKTNYPVTFFSKKFRTHKADKVLTA
jgi:hypothetical protein